MTNPQKSGKDSCAMCGSRRQLIKTPLDIEPLWKKVMELTGQHTTLILCEHCWPEYGHAVALVVDVVARSKEQFQKSVDESTLVKN